MQRLLLAAAAVALLLLIAPYFGVFKSNTSGRTSNALDPLAAPNSKRETNRNPPDAPGAAKSGSTQDDESRLAEIEELLK